MRSEPPQSSPGRSACRLPSSRLSDSISCGEPNACALSSISSCRCSGDIELSIRCAAAARCAMRVEQLVEVLRVLGEVVAVLCHELVEVLLGVDALAPLVEEVVEVAEHLVDGLAVLVGGVLERLSFMPWNRWSSSSRPSRSLICS